MRGTMLEGMCLSPSSPCSASAGSTATTWMSRRRALSPRPVPMTVPPVRILLRELAGETDRAVRLLQRIAEDDPSAEMPGDPLARLAHVAGHHQRHRHSQGRADPGIRDPGVSTGRVEERAPPEGWKRVLDDGQGRAILHASTWIEPPQLVGD